jgi:hypothetical protein
MEDLEQRVRNIVRASRDGAVRQEKAGELSGLDETGLNVAYLTAWCNGLEDAIAEVAREIERSVPRDQT